MPTLEVPRLTILSDNLSCCDGSPAAESDPFGLKDRLMPIFDILRHKDTAAPISAALCGAAGTGKTSALKWLIEKLELWNSMPPEERGGHPLVLPVWLSAQTYNSADTVLREMVSEIILQSLFRYGCISMGSPQREACLKKAVSVCGLALGKPFLNRIEGLALRWAILDSIKPELAKVDVVESRPEVCLEGFNTFFSDLLNPLPGPVRVAVFIDDLDYVQPDVMMAVFDAISSHLQFSQLVFVAGIDADVVKSLIVRHFASHGYSAAQSQLYLSKMFQVECPIEPSQMQIKDFYAEQVEALDRRTGGLFKSSLTKEYKAYIEAAVLHLSQNNPRKVKRHLNSALMSGFAETRCAGTNTQGVEFSCSLFARGIQIYLLHRWLSIFAGDGSLICRDDVLKWFAALSEESRAQGSDYNRVVNRDSAKFGQSINNAKRPVYGRSPDDTPQDPKRFDPPDGLSFSLFHEWVWDLLKIPFSREVTSRLPPPEESPARPLPTPEVKATQAISKALKDALTAALGRPVDDLSGMDLSKVVNLDLSGQQLSAADFVVIGGLDRLEHLNLYNTAAHDLSWIPKLCNLKSLNLSCTAVKDISPLTTLSHLDTIDLSYSGVVDLTPLANHLDMETLVLHGTAVKNLTALGRMTKLARLNLAHTGVTDADLSILEKLPCLKTLFLRETSVSSGRVAQLKKCLSYDAKIEF